MIKTLIIPAAAGLTCLIIAALIMSFVMPHINIDDSIKGLIKIAVWIIAFAGPADYLRKKAKKEQVAE